MSAPVVITGVGAVTPLGCGVEELFSGWMSGRSAIVDGRARCDFDPAAVLTRRELRNADRFTALAMAACEEAVESAGWHERPPDPGRTVCVIGTAAGGKLSLNEERERLAELGPGGVTPLGVTRQMTNGAPAMLSIRYGWTGESFALVSACTAGAQAIGAGVRMIRAGAADAAVVGGADSHFEEIYDAFFNIIGALSSSGECRPFDRRHDGFIPGEGAGILLLESEAAAARRGAPVLGRVLGYGAGSDATHLSVPRADGEGMRAAMARALEDADTAPGQISYVNAHGTSTTRNDSSEAKAISAVFGPEAVKVSSLKSVTGHMQGAAGAVETIATLWALRAGFAPPTVGLEDPLECDLDLVYGVPAELPRGKEGLIGMSNSLGLGGHNATLVIEAV